MGQFLTIIAVLLLLQTEFVHTECPSVCTSCVGSKCKNCEPSHYLADGYCFSCPENCLSCTDQTNCTKCKANKWGAQCIQDCSKECLNNECHDDTGYCLNCEHGKYGRRCQNHCSVCKNDHCDLYRCVEGCKSGYFEYLTDYDYFCQKCGIDCRECDNGIVCRICNDGFYLNQFNDNNGNTHVTCAQCLSENECSNGCVIEGCQLCQLVNNKLMCADCPEGETFNGVSCEQITQCSQKCSTNCDSNGLCLGNCRNGWTGGRCTERCNEKCLICSKNDINICIQCNGDFYSTDCSLACSQSCKIEEGKSTCTFDNGYCLHGCERGYWGDTCKNFCAEGCKDHVCDRSTGTCTRGCYDGYIGYNCLPISTINQKETPVTIKTTLTSMKATLNSTTTLTPNHASEDKVIFTIIGFFSGIGFSLVIVAIVTLLYYIRRRYFNFGNKTTQNNSRNVEIPTYTESANNYESLSNNRTRDNVYSDLGTTE